MDAATSVTTLQAIGFATGAALCGQLWWSQRRFVSVAADIRGTSAQSNRQHDGALWLIGLWWSAACGIQQVMLLAGMPPAAGPVAVMEWLAWGSTCCGPWLVVRLCEHWRIEREAVWRGLRRVAMNAGVGLTALWMALRMGVVAMTLDSFSVVSLYASLLHALACGVVLWRQPRPPPTSPGERSQRRWLVRIALALLGMQLGMVLLGIHAPARWVLLHVPAGFIAQHWVIPWALLVATLLAQAHYADVVLKRSLTLLASVTAATLLAWWTPGLPHGVPLLVASLAGAVLILVAPALHEAIQAVVDRGILHRPDYSALLREFVDASSRAADRVELFGMLQRSLGTALRLDARVQSATTPDSAASAPALRVTLDEEHCLELTPGPHARTLLQEERSFVDGVRMVCVRRLQTLELECARREQQLREERLQRSLSEAELRALRAQVDPHFLFNTLNTIADLIGTDVEQAEAMIERLAEFFRYTLTRQERTLATLDEELRFVRHYLAIEQVRFGKRLHVELQQDAAAGRQQVPALILQPLVENAVRHGLAPRIGPGSICVSATCSGEFLQLQIEDDGVGMPCDAAQRQGVGLRNVRERLSTLYQESAVMTIGPGARGRGTRVMLLLPRRESVIEHQTGTT